MSNIKGFSNKKKTIKEIITQRINKEAKEIVNIINKIDTKVEKSKETIIESLKTIPVDRKWFSYRKKTKDKILIVGSGLSAKQLKYFNDNDWTIIAINNAWKLNKWDILIYPDDFPDIPESLEKDQFLADNNIYRYEVNKFGGQENVGNSMIFNAAYFALAQFPSKIAFLGCDLWYPPNQVNHFYGNGRPDPMRLGRDLLIEKLNRLNDFCKKYNVEVSNFSEQENTLLPFKREEMPRRKKALFISFNDSYAKYASAWIYSFNKHNPEYDIICFATNVNANNLSKYPFNLPCVKIINEHKDFIDNTSEKHYMNSSRFCKYIEYFDDYDFVIMSDVDQICLKSMREIEKQSVDNDFGFIYNPEKEEKNKIQACFIAMNVNDKTKELFDNYTKELFNRDSEWFNDQLTLSSVILNNKKIKLFRILREKYASWRENDDTAIIITCTENKFHNEPYTRWHTKINKTIDIKNENNKYCIHDGYHHRDKITHYDDRKNTDFWQKATYETALKIAEENKFKKILDIGTGSAYKLIKYFDKYDTLGLELEPSLSYIKEKYPDKRFAESNLYGNINEKFDIAICSDVIEHISNPDDMIEFFKRIDCQYLVISTPARDYGIDTISNGPPINRCHHREWNMEEFYNYMTRHFNVIDHIIDLFEGQKSQIIVIRKY